MTETSVYHNLFNGPKSVVSQFGAPEDALKDAIVYYANYEYEDYNGCAVVVFKKAGKLYEVHGSHCSCYGLEGQWEPEETSWAAIAMRPEHELVSLAKRKSLGLYDTYEEAKAVRDAKVKTL
jgi:hypothetical protein